MIVESSAEYIINALFLLIIAAVATPFASGIPVSIGAIIMAFYTYLLLLLLPLASAGSVQPSNDTLPVQASPLLLNCTSTGGMTVTAVLAPLTPEIGLGQDLTALSVSTYLSTTLDVDIFILTDSSPITSKGPSSPQTLIP